MGPKLLIDEFIDKEQKVMDATLPPLQRRLTLPVPEIFEEQGMYVATQLFLPGIEKKEEDLFYFFHTPKGLLLNFEGAKKEDTGSDNEVVYIKIGDLLACNKGKKFIWDSWKNPEECSFVLRQIRQNGHCLFSLIKIPKEIPAKPPSSSAF